MDAVSAVGPGILAALIVVLFAAGAAAAWSALNRLRARLRALDQRLAALHAGLADLRTDLARQSTEVTAVAARGNAQSDALGAVIRQLNRSVVTRIDLLADWMAKGAGADARTQLARELEERDFFVETLGEGRIRPLHLPQLFPGIETERVEIGTIDPDTKHPNQVDMLYVSAIARHRRARRVFEFGTYLGRTTYHLALGEHVERVYTLDLDPAGPYPQGLKIGRAIRAVHERDLQGYFYRGTAAAERIVQLHGDSRTFDYGPYAGQMDLVFVDGGHTYEMVANDTQHALSLVKPGGLIIWHDFAPKGRDVAALAREFARERPLFWIEDTSLLVYIDGVDAVAYDAPTPVYSRTLIKPE
jgi:predicted O-methyltransferase YrrM